MVDCRGRIAIFTDDPGWHGKRLKEAFLARGYESSYVSLTDCRIEIDGDRCPVIVAGFEDGLPDAVFVRGVPGGTLDEVVFYLDILHTLKRLGIPVYNDGAAIERSVDKSLTSVLLRLAGVPTPATWICRSHDAALAIAQAEINTGHDILSKPLFGSQGEGICRYRSSAELEALQDTNGIYYLQRFVGGTQESSFDWRVFVVNGRSVAAMKRVGDSWLNNIARGARCEAVDLSDELAALADRAIAALSMDYGGVDIIRGDDGKLLVIEVNSIPAWKGLQSVCQSNIAELLADDLIDRHLLADLSQLAVAQK